VTAKCVEEQGGTFGGRNRDPRWVDNPVDDRNPLFPELRVPRMLTAECVEQNTGSVIGLVRHPFSGHFEQAELEPPVATDYSR
jgi:hypothetical protein